MSHDFRVESVMVSFYLLVELFQVMFLQIFEVNQVLEEIELLALLQYLFASSNQQDTLRV